MKKWSLQNILQRVLLFLTPVAIVLVVVAKSHPLSFHVVDLRYGQDTIDVRSMLEWRFSRPSWWPHDERHYFTNLSFVSATIKDSRGNVIPVDEITGGDLFPGDFLEENEPDFEHYGHLRPRFSCDLSHGGTMTMRMEVRGENSSKPILWQGELSAPLPPTSAFADPQTEQEQ